MKASFHLAGALALACLLAACGGGGGDPGTCHGSPEVCSEGQATHATAPTGSTGSTGPSTTTTTTTTTANAPAIPTPASGY